MFRLVLVIACFTLCLGKSADLKNSKLKETKPDALANLQMITTDILARLIALETKLSRSEMRLSSMRLLPMREGGTRYGGADSSEEDSHSHEESHRDRVDPDAYRSGVRYSSRAQPTRRYKSYRPRNYKSYRPIQLIDGSELLAPIDDVIAKPKAANIKSEAEDLEKEVIKKE